MKSKKQVRRHRNKSKKFRKMKGAGGRQSRPRETIQGEATVNPMQNQDVAAPFLQTREDRRQEERRIVENAQRQWEQEHADLAQMVEEQPIDPILDQDMIDAIEVADNFDAMNEAHQHQMAIEAGINTGQRRPEGGGGRATNQFASGIRGRDNPYVPVRLTKSNQRIPLNPNRQFPTADERNIDRRDRGFEARYRDMTIEEYEDSMRELIPGNWRYDYNRLLVEQKREQR